MKMPLSIMLLVPLLWLTLPIHLLATAQIALDSGGPLLLRIILTPMMLLAAALLFWLAIELTPLLVEKI